MSTPRRVTRRDFLQGKAAAEAVADLAAGVSFEDGGAAEAESTRREVQTDESFSVPRCGDPRYLVTLNRRAMACNFAIYLNAGQYVEGTDAALEALDLVDRLEDQLTIYRDTSELIEVNRRAGVAAVEVEAGLFDLLHLALRIHDETDGAFDITAGPLSQAWGFSRREGHVPDEDEIEAALDRVGSRYVQLDEAAQTVRFLRSDMELSVNGIGKGYALDRGGAVLREAGVTDFLFHGGQSSVLASGSYAAAGGRGWTVGLTHPMRPQQRIAEFFLRDRALGTSGSGIQSFHAGGRRYGHVLDPRTGWPVEGVYSATVLAPTAAEADALATAFYVLGPDHAEEVCQRRPELAMALVCCGPREGAIELFTHGLTDDDWRAPSRV